MTTPYVGFTNETLAKQPKMVPGDEIECPHCKGKHKVEDSEPSGLYFFDCNGKTYLAGLYGKSVLKIRSDVHGEIGR